MIEKSVLAMDPIHFNQDREIKRLFAKSGVAPSDLASKEEENKEERQAQYGNLSKKQR